MTPLSWALVGVVAGGAITTGGFLVFNKDEAAAAPTIIVAPPDEEAEAVLALSDISVIQPVCQPGFIEQSGDGLCRELFCWMQTNSQIGETSGLSCDAISNINNTVVILDTCGVIEDPVEVEACYTLFRERK